MPDRYPDFASLAASESEGIDFRITLRPGSSGVAIVAPHGGGIEPGTSELARAMSGNRHALYAFEGIKSVGNSTLHLTGSRFDEPRCLALLAQAVCVVTVHGERSSDEVVYLGGLDGERREAVAAALRSSGFVVAAHRQWGGTEPLNLCNRGRSGAGVQLEVSRGLRRAFFESLDVQGRKSPTPRFERFTAALGPVFA